MLPVRPYANIEWGSVIYDTHEDLDVTNAAAVGLTAATLDTKHVGIVIRNEGATVRYRFGSTDPVTSQGTGTILFDTEWITLNYAQAKAFRVIADSATSSKLRVDFFKGTHS